jgi:DNA-3-methyladenine glycosylase
MESTAKILDATFFSRPALKVARDLIGKYLVREIGGQQIAAMITETEAYIGPHDKACHAHRGRTPRTGVMFGPAGVWYVYFIYGMHEMLNVVTDVEEYPSAVLFRAAGNWVGPGRLTRAMDINRELNGRPASKSTGLWVEDRGLLSPRRKILRTPRIGVAYAGEWAEKPYRFLLAPSASKRRVKSN